MKNCIIQYFIDPAIYEDPDYNNLSREQDTLAHYSKTSFEKYAEKIGCDFKHITKPKINFKHPTFERFDLWLDNSWWEQYDQIMYVDSDVYALPDAPNIFEEYKELDTLKVCESNKFQNAGCQEHYDNLQKGLLKEIDIEIIKEKGFQPGVFILNKTVVDQTLPYIKQYKELNTHDGDVLLWSVCKSDVKIQRLSWKYNYKRAYFMDAPKVYFFHAMGQKKIQHKARIIHFLKKNKII